MIIRYLAQDFSKPVLFHLNTSILLCSFPVLVILKMTDEKIQHLNHHRG